MYFVNLSHMSSALSRSSVIWCFKCGNATEIRSGLIFNLYVGLSHNYTVNESFVQSIILANKHNYYLLINLLPIFLPPSLLPILPLPLQQSFLFPLPSHQVCLLAKVFHLFLYSFSKVTLSLGILDVSITCLLIQLPIHLLSEEDSVKCTRISYY